MTEITRDDIMIEHSILKSDLKSITSRIEAITAMVQSKLTFQCHIEIDRYFGEIKIYNYDVKPFIYLHQLVAYLTENKTMDYDTFDELANQ